MSYKIELYVEEIENIRRTIVVNDDVPLDLFIRGLILSLNGNTNKFYFLINGEEIIEFTNADNLSFLHLKVGDTYYIKYDVDDKPWYIVLNILDKNTEPNQKKIEILDGIGYGIAENQDMYTIRDIINSKSEKWKQSMFDYYKTLNAYFLSTFSLTDSQKAIEDYIIQYEETHKPKSIVMNVSLNCFDKYIKRKIRVNNDIIIDKFCRALIASMNGDLSHLYTIKMGKNWCDEAILDRELNYLDLPVGKKFKVIYDYGDNWEFNIRISKITDGHSDKEFEVLDGKGYGIVEDCGGVYRLGDIYNGESEYFGSYDIEEFDLPKIQRKVDRELKVENLHQLRLQEDYY